jgi:hypothetical protein
MDGGDGPKIWRKTENKLIKRLWVSDKQWSSSLAVGRDANNYIKKYCTGSQI